MSDPLIETKSHIHHLTEDERGWVWLATYANGIHKVEGLTKKITKPPLSTLKVIQYDTLKGLPGIRQNSVCFVNGILYAGAEDGLYRYHKDRDTFERDTLLDRFFPTKAYSCGLLARGMDESLWIPVSSGFDTHTYSDFLKMEILKKLFPQEETVIIKFLISMQAKKASLLFPFRTSRYTFI